jgi:ubiquinone/menaquinone biosynthesis C-methylase UbiE
MPDISTSSHKIEIISVHYLDTHQELASQFLNLSTRLKKGLGWHYLLDLTWAAYHLDPASGMKILDAGAGTGILQWWLVENAVDVISVDQLSRQNLPDQLRRQYRVKGWRREDLSPSTRVTDWLPPRSLTNWKKYPAKLMETCQKFWQHFTTWGKPKGIVYIYNRDLMAMSHIPDNHVDVVVSISALEHNSPDKLRSVVAELMRVLKPGGKLIATLGAASMADWFHEPSQGWCYTESTLRGIFGLPDDTPSNYDQFDALFEKLKCNDFLRENLANFYFQSGNNGMPWGKWDPQYQPVGIVKVK